MYVVVVCSEAGKLPRLFVRVKFPFPLINNGIPWFHNKSHENVSANSIKLFFLLIFH